MEEDGVRRQTDRWKLGRSRRSNKIREETIEDDGEGKLGGGTDGQQKGRNREGKKQ